MALLIGYSKRPQSSSNRLTRLLNSGSRAICLALLFWSGCNQASPSKSSVTTEDTRRQLQQLEQRLAMLQQENQALRLQLEGMAPAGQRPYQEDLLRLTRIRLTRYTGLYDKDRDGVPEQLIVYVQPLDRQEDVVKAPGSMVVQVWDLASEPNKALLASWSIGPEELRTMWSATLLTINYRLVFDVPQGLPRDRPLTVKVVFTDALTGRTYTDQRLIKPP